MLWGFLVAARLVCLLYGNEMGMEMGGRLQMY